MASRDATEASLRTAVGRLYYAVFLSTRETLGVVGRNRIHHRVAHELRGLDRYAASQLQRLGRLRVAADYEVEGEDPLRADWRRNYQMARRLADFVLERLP